MNFATASSVMATSRATADRLARRIGTLPAVLLGLGAVGLVHCSAETAGAELDPGASEESISNSKPIDAAPEIVLRSTITYVRPDGSECSGTVVGLNRIVTAKHCVEANNPSGHRVRFTSEQSPSVLYIQAGAIKTHPTADVAVMKLVSLVPARAREKVARVHSPRQGSIQRGDRVIIAGFGDTCETGPACTGKPLRWGKTKFDRWVGDYRFRLDTFPLMGTYSHGLQFAPEACTGNDPACSNICPGDSGGPVYQWRPGEGWGLIGVNSVSTCDGVAGTGILSSMVAADARALVDFILYD